MATSQFKIYTSSDAYGPGLITGFSGSLVNILTACLVGGYGTSSYYKAPAGWSKPINDVLSGAGIPILACYQPPSGSRFTMFVNDGYPNATALGKEAWVCGYENIRGLTSSLYPAGTVYTASAGNGAGDGQFPLPAQLLTYGHVVWRKSTTTDAVGRPWIIVADAYTMYMWIATGDTANAYIHGGFGAIYSFAQNDVYNCFLYGRILENSATTNPTTDWTHLICVGAGYQVSGQLTQVSYNIAQPGHYFARATSGIGGSVGFTKKGDAQNDGGTVNATPMQCSMYGLIQSPNTADNSYYLQPLQAIDPVSVSIRGRLRGLYQPCHPMSSLSDGQVISGGGDYAGKTFQIIKFDGSLRGAWALEISNTVEAN